MVRRLGLILLSLVLLCAGLFGCAAPAAEDNASVPVAADEALLYDQGLELAELLEEMLGSSEYFQLMGVSREISDILSPYARADFSEPESAYRVTLPEDALPMLMDMAEVDLDGFSEPLREFLKHRILSSVPTMLNAQGGSMVLAAASTCTVSNTWVGEALEQDCYLLYFYPDACPVVITFHGGKGFVEGSAMLLPGSDLPEGSLSAVEELFDALGLDGLRVEEMAPFHNAD